MAASSGAATADRFNMTSSFTVGGNNTSSFWCGWWYPTTLTAGRFYANPPGMNIMVHTTTSELDLFFSLSTTARRLATSGAGITTGKWYFIAILRSSTVSASEVPTVWIGTLDSAPVQQTLTVTVAGSGTTAGGTTMTVVGSAGSFAWQGYAADFLYFSDATNSILNMFGFAPNNTPSADELNRVYSKFVHPCYRGKYPPQPGSRMVLGQSAVGVANGFGFRCNMRYLTTSPAVNTRTWGRSGTSPGILNDVATMTGTVPQGIGNPKGMDNWHRGNAKALAHRRM